MGQYVLLICSIHW